MAVLTPRGWLSSGSAWFSLPLLLLAAHIFPNEVRGCPVLDGGSFDGLDDEDDSGPSPEQWQCARAVDSATNEILWDEACLQELHQQMRQGVQEDEEEGGEEDVQEEQQHQGEAEEDDDEEGSEEKTEFNACDAYWGREKPDGEWEQGLWDELTGRHGAMMFSCYAEAKASFTAELGGEEAVNALSPKAWNRARLEIDKRCVSRELCALERRKRGWCSRWYRRVVAPSCASRNGGGQDFQTQDAYRRLYCKEVCPRVPAGEGTAAAVSSPGSTKNGEKMPVRANEDSGIIEEEETQEELLAESFGFEMLDEAVDGRAAFPPPPRAHKGADAVVAPAAKEAMAEEEGEDEQEALADAEDDAAAGRTKCPVKKIGFYSRKVARRVGRKVKDAGSQAYEILKRVLPALLAPPEKPAPTASSAAATVVPKPLPRLHTAL